MSTNSNPSRLPHVTGNHAGATRVSWSAKPDVVLYDRSAQWSEIKASNITALQV